MTVTTQQQQRQPQYAPPTHYQQAHKNQPNQQNQHAALMVWSSLKASFAGGIGLLLLMLLSLIPPNENIPFFSLAYLVWPGFPVVCLATGLLASLMASDSIRNTHQGGKVGWMAGFWAGVYGGIIAMIMAAAGFLMVDLGQNIASQFMWLVDYGVNFDTLSLAGRVFWAMIIFGVGGSMVSAMLSSIGGMIYPKLNVAE
ncbi:hypothetical protein QUF64_01695 [Anaerolineales bacterium HSG6]|nr:hypothetical protein [Anaerolineales bacterium HSG6]MDM8530572.1 hypothetical protein [Anaerolineales bacterium HSG25]